MTVDWRAVNPTRGRSGLSVGNPAAFSVILSTLTAGRYLETDPVPPGLALRANPGLYFTVSLGLI